MSTSRETGDAGEELRRRVARSPHYPQFHVAPPFGWMNDPHPIYFKGAYHMFYQYSFLPDSPYGGPHCWGHVISPDLVHWRHLPNAITPKNHGIAEDRHIWSGCLVDKDGVGTAIYTMDNIDIWIATSTDDDLARFTKHESNPVVKGPPPGLDIRGGMRDPWVWREDDGWYMIIGSGLAGERGPVLPLYRSIDLVDWEYLHPLYEGNTEADTAFCECPSFFPLGDKHVLVMSHEAAYLVGRYEDHRFIPESRGRLDHGWIYVPQFILDDKGRRIMWAWVRESRDPEIVAEAGWASMQTLPRVLSLRPDGALEFEPAEEVELLRSDHRRFENVRLADTSVDLEGVGGAQLEIRVMFRLGGADYFGLAWYDGAEQIEVRYDVEAEMLTCKGCAGYAAPLALGEGESLTLRVFFDGSVAEVYANGHVCITERLYPADPAAMKVRLFAAGGEATAGRVDAWTLGTIWAAEETE